MLAAQITQHGFGFAGAVGFAGTAPAFAALSVVGWRRWGATGALALRFGFQVTFVVWVKTLVRHIKLLHLFCCIRRFDDAIGKRPSLFATCMVFMAGFRYHRLRHAALRERTAAPQKQSHQKAVEYRIFHILRGWRIRQ